MSMSNWPLLLGVVLWSGLDQRAYYQSITTDLTITKSSTVTINNIIFTSITKTTNNAITNTSIVTNPITKNITINKTITNTINNTSPIQSPTLSPTSPSTTPSVILTETPSLISLSPSTVSMILSSPTWSPSPTPLPLPSMALRQGLKHLNNQTCEGVRHTLWCYDTKLHSTHIKTTIEKY